MLSFIKAKPRRHSSLLFHFHVCTTRQACVTVGAFDAFDRFSEVIHKAVINSKKILIIVRKKNPRGTHKSVFYQRTNQQYLIQISLLNTS